MTLNNYSICLDEEEYEKKLKNNLANMATRRSMPVSLNPVKRVKRFEAWREEEFLKGGNRSTRSWQQLTKQYTSSSAAYRLRFNTGLRKGELLYLM